ncbi:MAG TPA: hypothetical protein VNO22_16885 [Planctomycetota bacterium]|nr:hypothetical protein [Planctomycetota bacterium]
MRRFSLLPALAALGACSSVRSDLAAVRMEIVELERRLPPEAPLWISEGPDRFDAFLEDRTDHVPAHIYVHLLRKLHAMPPAEVEALSAGDFDFQACVDDPSRFRGKVWRIRGVAADLRPEPVRDALSPVPQVFAGLLVDDGGRPAVFHVVRKPDVLTLRQDVVETRAVFVKLVEAVTRSGARVTAPFFVGQTLRRYL